MILPPGFLGALTLMILPIAKQLKGYTASALQADLSAGLTVAVMLIPQAMAYALLAGLPPVIGLYSATAPLIVYALFASSRQLAVGPVAIVSLLSLSGVSQLAEVGSGDFIAYSILLALLVGVIQTLLGLVRAGVIVNFLSHSVISGFTSAAALIIGLSQLRHLFGLRLPSAHSTLEQLWLIVSNLDSTHLSTLVIGVASIALLVAARRVSKRFPAPILVVAAGAALVYGLGLHNAGVSIVGDIPRGLPRLSLPPVDLAVVLRLLPVALTIALVGFMESFAVAQSIASREKYKLSANQELIALGIANLASALFGGYAVTGGFSRTAVNYQAGAKTQLAALVTVLVLIITLLFLTPLFYYLPNAVLAAIVLVAVSSLIDWRYPRALFRIKPIDGWTAVVTFAATLLLDVELGILVGVIFSLAVFIWRSAHPHIAELGYLAEQGIYRNVRRYPQAQRYQDIAILRVDAALYFANMAYLERYLNTLIAEREGLKQIVLDFSAINDIDAVALETLEALMHAYAHQGIRVLVCGMKGPVRDVVYRAGWFDTFADSLSYNTVEQALAACDACMLPPEPEAQPLTAADDIMLRVGI
jgi:SulP family sulfate permease